MKYRIIKVFVFVFMVFLFDRLGGFALYQLYNKTNDFSISKLRYTLDSTNQDILIFGSSRVLNQYIPRIIEKNTGLSTYNCGFGGQGVRFSYIQLCESLKRYNPKMVILDILPNVLLDPESEQKLKFLLPYYDRDTLIYNSITNNKSMEKIKLISSIYPYNSSFISIAAGIFKEPRDSLHGFIPLKRTIDTTNLTNRLNSEYLKSEIPIEKFTYLRKIINICNRNNIKIVIVVSPFYEMNKNIEKMNGQIKEICTYDKNVVFLDYSNYLEIYQQAEYFQDNFHLNYKGSEVFSEALSKNIKVCCLN